MLRIIAGTARGRRIDTPAGMDTRPTLDRVRENLFNMLQTRIREARVLDPFAGSGALSLEALSRGAACAVMGDRDREACRVERKNIETLGFQDQARVMPGEWQRNVALLKAEKARFDLVFLDPPYAMRDLRELMDALAELLAEGAWIIVEHEAKAQILPSAGFELLNARSWGYCGVSFFAPKAAEEKEERTE